MQLLNGAKSILIKLFDSTVEEWVGPLMHSWWNTFKAIRWLLEEKNNYGQNSENKILVEVN